MGENPISQVLEGKVTLNWIGVTDATEYTVERKGEKEEVRNFHFRCIKLTCKITQIPVAKFIYFAGLARSRNHRRRLLHRS